MSRQIHIVTSCTDRKKSDIPQRLRLGSLRGKHLEERVERWGERLATEDCDAVAASDLYSGDHWSISRQLPEVAVRAGLDPVLWICSAGYGLVAETRVLKPYSATFAVGHEDSVGRHCTDLSPREAAEAWWSALAISPHLRNGAPRELCSVRRNDRDLLLVIASPPYLAAMRADLISAACGGPDRVLVVSAGAAGDEAFRELLLPADARFQRRLGGARQALNARIAKDALASMARMGEQDFSGLRDRYARKLREERPLVNHDRTPMSDDEVCGFIRLRLAENPKIRHTPLLRELRESGRACEQRRFRDLFAHEKEKLNGEPR